MPKEIHLYGYVKEGRLRLYNQGALSSGLQNFEGQDVELVITKRKRVFSDNHRAYYFAVIVRQFQEAIWYAWGEKYTLEDVDYFLRDMYLYDERIDPETGEIHRETKTLRKGETTVSRGDFLEYCSLCIQIAAYYLNWAIPFPNEELDLQERVNNRRTIAEGTATR